MSDNLAPLSDIIMILGPVTAERWGSPMADLISDQETS